jgi:hypothetical protein
MGENILVFPATEAIQDLLFKIYVVKISRPLKPLSNIKDGCKMKTFWGGLPQNFMF